MKYYAGILAALLCACSDDGPTGVGDSWHVGPVVVAGFVQNGDGQLAGNMAVHVSLLPVGCEGERLRSQSAVVSSTGGYSVAFPSDTFPKRVCVRVVTDAWRGQTWDDNVEVRDSVTAAQGAVIDLRYDWARSRVSTYIAPKDSLTITPAEFEFVVVDGAEPMVIPGSSLTRPPGFTSAWRESALFETATSGALRVRVQYSGSAGSGGGVIEALLGPDRVVGIVARIKDRNSSEGCFGCHVVAAFPLTRNGILVPDSLYVTVGSLPASYMVIY
jgi:hypothetical protein